MDSDTSDEEDLLFILDYVDCIELLPRVIRDRTDNFNAYADEEFRIRFRLSKHSVLNILDLIHARLQHSSERNMPVSPLDQLLLALRFYATSSFQVNGIIVINTLLYLCFLLELLCVCTVYIKIFRMTVICAKL